jgi:hypothetical protein
VKRSPGKAIMGLQRGKKEVLLCQGGACGSTLPKVKIGEYMHSTNQNRLALIADVLGPDRQS